MIREADSMTPENVLMLKERINEIEKDIEIEDTQRRIEGWFNTATSLACILPILEVNAQLRGIANDEPGN